MGKRPHDIFIEDGKLHFSRHAKPIVQSVPQTGFSIHIYNEEFCRDSGFYRFVKTWFGLSFKEVKYGAVVQIKKKFFRGSWLQPTIEDAVQAALAKKDWMKKKSPDPSKLAPPRTDKKYELHEVLDHVLFERKRNKKSSQDKDYDGDFINMASDRYQCFAMKGTRCVTCGLDGQFFRKDKTGEALKYHFNLYGVKEGGIEVLFSKDHIIPQSKGGKNNLSNYQTMCMDCNSAKGNELDLVI